MKCETETCDTCGGHGFRVEISTGSTVNAIAAQDFGLMAGTRRVLCDCQLVDGIIKSYGAEAAPKPHQRRKRTRKKSIDVAGIRPEAYVDRA